MKRHVVQAHTEGDVCVKDNFNGGFMHVIHMLYMGIQKHLEQSLAQHKQISFSQFVILVGFFWKDNPCVTQAKLAEHLMLTEATVSRHISILVTMKLLSKEKDPTNKKSYLLSLTKEGSQAFLSAKGIITKELDTLFSHISEKDRSVMIKNFTKTIEILQQKK